MAKKQTPLRIIPLGGLDGIGKNMTAFEYGSDMILVDAGLMFPDDEQPGIDLILPDYSYVLENEEKLRGIIITHGHEDHTGALPYVLMDLAKKVPIYSSKLTLGILEGKLAEHKINSPKFRDVSNGTHINLGAFSIDFFSMTHSIPGALGVYMRTPAGSVMHTGDFKLDQTPIDGVTPNYQAINRFATLGVDLLMSDSTNATRPGFTKSESAVGPAIRHIIKNAKGRVIVASFSSHIHRLQQICDASTAVGRKVVVTGRSMVQNTKIARELGYLKIDPDDIIDGFEVEDIPDDKIVVMCTGSQGEPMSALSRMANGDHKSFTITADDTVIISANPIPGNEKSVQGIINSLSKIGCAVYDKSTTLVHVSGHGSQEELKLMLAMAKPRFFMPVHGEAVHLRAHAKLAQEMARRPHLRRRQRRYARDGQRQGRLGPTRRVRCRVRRRPLHHRREPRRLPRSPEARERWHRHRRLYRLQAQPRRRQRRDLLPRRLLLGRRHRERGPGDRQADAPAHGEQGGLERRVPAQELPQQPFQLPLEQDAHATHGHSGRDGGLNAL